MRPIYLDYAATTPVAPEVFEAMRPYFSEKFGNPASFHSFGQETIKAVDEARAKIANFLNCQIQEVIFTSGATESNNFAIKGIVETAINHHTKNFGVGVKPHIIISKIEHHSVFEVAQYLKKQGVEVTYLPVNHDGLLNTKIVQSALKKNTVLVSIMYANNEIGAIQLISEIGEILKTENEKRKKIGKRKIIFHTDATQAIEYLDCDVQKLGVDLLSFSGHKIYGPKGVGVLYIKRGTPIKPCQHGGAQEYYMRAGTLNVPGIVGIGKATELIRKPEHKKEIIRIKDLRDSFTHDVLKMIPETQLNGSKNNRLPNNINISFKKIEGESIILHLDFTGIAVSTGSACASGSLKPSHVLMALGLSHELAHGSVRFSLGKYTTKNDLDYVIKLLPPIVKKLRKMSPIK